MIRRLHRLNALLLLLFILPHLLNHLMGFLSIEHHIHMMDWLRNIYRQFLFEVVLLGLFFTQIVLGLLLTKLNERAVSFWVPAQKISGIVLGFFLLQHMGAILFMRLSSPLDTNFYWAAAVVAVNPIRWYFIPYYWLGITAIFVHIAAALKFNQIGPAYLHFGLVALGVLISSVIVLVFSGVLYPVYLPETYIDYLKVMYSIISV